MGRQPIPPYRAVSAALRERIEAGEWLPGEQLPSVRHLAKHYKVSINTARRAVDLLKEDGLVTVEPGWGVFRAAP
jgi:GntR family transcriptional regulator